MKKDYSSKELPTLFIVETSKDFDGMEKGSRISVQRERGNEYEGVLCAEKSYYVAVPKDICEKLKE